jgi:Ca2+-binding EF-hand superfamily protein
VHLAQEDEWRATFKMLDLDGSGSIDADEFEKACKSLGITLSKTDQAVLMQEFDTNGDNVIDFSEFCQLLRSLG